MVNIISDYIPPFSPLPNIAPFTYKDGETYLSTLENLRTYVNTTLVDFVNTNFTSLGDSFSTEVNTLIDQIQGQLTEQNTNVTTQLTEQNISITEQTDALTTYVNSKVQEIIDTTITVTDPIILGVLENIVSETRVLLDSIYASSIDFDAVKATVDNGRLSLENMTTIDNRINKLESFPQIFSEEYGIKGDGSDESVIINQFLLSAVNLGAIATFKRGITVSVGAPVTPPSGSRVNLNGGTIKLLPVGAIDLRAIILNGVSDIEIYNGFIDGNYASYVPATEQRHNIHVTNSTNIKLHDIKSFNAKGDGIYIGDNLSGYSKDIYLDRVHCDANYRQGMSITHVSNMAVNDSIFSNTIGTAPQAGVDIEPNDPAVLCENIRFTNCTFKGNSGPGMAVTLQANPSARQAGFTFTNCVSTTNFAGYDLRDAKEVSIIGGSSYANAQQGIKMLAGFGSVIRGIKIISCNVKSNGQDGILVHSTTQIFDLNIIDCTVSDNSTSAMGSFMGIWINPLAGSKNVIVNSCLFENVSQHYHLRTAATLSNLTLIGNRYMAADPGGDDILLLDDAISRIQFESLATKGKSGTTAQRPSAAHVGIGSQYFDTTLGKPIWSTGSGAIWKDATGATV